MEQNLPKAIQAELDAAAEIEAQIAAEQAPSTDEPKAPEQSAAPEPVAGNEPSTPPAAQGSQEDESWKKRFDVLTGKYNAEVPRLHDQLREQTNALEKLQQELEALKTKAPSNPEPETPLVTSNDEETFGADLIDLARRITRDEQSKVLKELAELRAAVQAISNLPKQVERVVEQQAISAEERYWNAVKAVVPDWDSIDQDGRWIDWLQLTPPFSVKTYRELAMEAIQAGLVQPIVELVKEWKTQAGIAQNVQANQAAKQELQSQMAPSKSNASSVPTAKKVWTGAEYERAFDPRLSKEMSESDIEALQAEAELAYSEGRIQW